MQTYRLSLCNSGCGGFLNPPNHPESTYSFQDSRTLLSLSGALKDGNLDPYNKRQARELLETWEKEKYPLDHSEVTEWIHQVLGYFKGCYQNPETKSWNVDDIVIDDKRNRMSNADTHCGVHFIRKYYPEYKPSIEDFNRAKWGK